MSYLLKCLSKSLLCITLIVVVSILCIIRIFKFKEDLKSLIDVIKEDKFSETKHGFIILFLISLTLIITLIYEK